MSMNKTQDGMSDQDLPAQIPASCHPLPKLCHVHLFGVPLNWTGFLHVLGVDHQIQSLELSHHDEGDRPTFDQFSAMIKGAPLGVYRDGFSLDALFSRLDAPNLVALSIEDVNPTVPQERPIFGLGINTEYLLSYCATGFSKHPVHATVTAFSLFMSAFPQLHHLSLLCTPNALAALLLDADCPALASILVCPVTQPEVLKLKQLKNIGRVLEGDAEELSPTISPKTIDSGPYSFWARM
ncbi:hypothetical protein DFJ58DRAFT_730565 [Suillus subalutaceus]|uniref:uncharacterized protein n=1 Tax=Suillus subalutaceus TaxID=48586 RepID=UPI001B87B689|nr:uncharacterized protein DFJ58DRAFT_730565 [Suillus subalutaceus]KAG1846426.1 hypothetical protein DFJ58DRAFT_730565 [Suillus subalutaceus]